MPLPEYKYIPEDIPTKAIAYYGPVWTTADEIAFVNGLYFRGRVETLRKYLVVALARDWAGQGMSVDKREVIQVIERCLRHCYERRKK